MAEPGDREEPITTLDDETLATIKACDPAFHALNNRNLVTYVTLVIPACLKMELKRKDSIIRDPYTHILDRDLAHRIIKFCVMHPTDSVNFMILCGYAIEQVLITRDPRIHQIVQLGCDCSTYPYWMDEVRDCKVYQMASNPVLMDEFLGPMADAGHKMIVREYHWTVTNLLLDTWQDWLMGEGFDPSQPTLWMVGNTLSNRFKKDDGRMLELIDELSSPHSQVYGEMNDAHLFNVKIGDKPEFWFYPGADLVCGNDGMAFRSLAEWSVELLIRRDNNLEYRGTMWDEERMGHLCVTEEEEVTLGPFFLARFSKPE